MSKFLRNASIRERLLHRRRINETTECWLYTGAQNHGGYGVIDINGKSQRVHVISYIEFVGLPNNSVLHKTTCPYKHCFNPEHLYDGTHIDNMNDLKSINGFFKNGRGLGAITRTKGKAGK